MATKQFICNFSCTCNNSRCAYDHPTIKFDDRNKLNELFKQMPELKEMKEEITDEKYKSNCKHSFLCKMKDCKFRHNLSYEGRIKFIDAVKEKKIIKTEEKIVLVKMNKIKELMEQQYKITLTDDDIKFLTL